MTCDIHVDHEQFSALHIGNCGIVICICALSGYSQTGPAACIGTRAFQRGDHGCHQVFGPVQYCTVPLGCSGSVLAPGCSGCAVVLVPSVGNRIGEL